MSQTFNIPAASGDQINDTFQAVFDALATLRSGFAGASAPSSPVDGQMWFDTTSSALKMYVSSAWVVALPNFTVDGGGLLKLTGGALTGALAMGAQKITGLAAAVEAADAVNKGQVDARARCEVIPLGDLTASLERYLLAGMPALTIVEVSIVADAATTSDGSNNWAADVKKVPADTSILTAVFSSNGSEFAAHVPKQLGVAASTTLAADEVLQLQLTKTGSPGDLTGAAAVIRYTLDSGA